MKYIGLAVIFFSTSYIGILLSNITKQSLSQEKELLRFVIFARQEVELFSSTQNEIINSFSTNDINVRNFLDSVLYETWQSANYSVLNISETTKTQLVELGKEFGSKTKEELLFRLDKTISSINDSILSKESEINNKVKVRLTLWICTGALLVILFI